MGTQCCTITHLLILRKDKGANIFFAFGLNTALDLLVMSINPVIDAGSSSSVGPGHFFMEVEARPALGSFLQQELHDLLTVQNISMPSGQNIMN